MKKLGILLLVLGISSFAVAQADADQAARLEQTLNRLQSNKRQHEENVSGPAIKLSTQGQAFVNRILNQLQNAKREIREFPYPPQATDKNQKERLGAIEDIAASLTVVMDEYNSVRKRDVLAARVAGARIGAEVLVSKDGKKFGVQEFLQDHEAEMADAVMVDELAAELNQFAMQLAQDVRSMNK